MYLGLDLGTSSVKALIVDASGTAVASQSVPLQVIRRKAGWSEQDPQSWWDAEQGCSVPWRRISRRDAKNHRDRAVGPDAWADGT